MPWPPSVPSAAGPVDGVIGAARAEKLPPHPGYPAGVSPALLRIDPRFCGPPGTANGGYAAGLLGTRLSGPARVRLRRPVPLETPLEVVAVAGGGLELRQGPEVVASAEPATLALALPPLPGAAEAREASRGYAGHRQHPFPRCFVCGPARAEGDGLRLFAGPWRPGVVATPWTPHASLDAGDGTVRPELVWAALDCPGYFASRDDGATMLLGELTAQLEAPVPVGAPCTVVGWLLEVSGRKRTVGTAVLDAGGRCLARARAVWVEPRG